MEVRLPFYGLRTTIISAQSKTRWICLINHINNHISSFLTQNSPIFIILLKQSMEMYEPMGNTTDGFYSRQVPGYSKLWVDSEITGKFVSPQLSFAKEQRFKWGSIYWPEDNDQLFAMKRKRKSEVYEMASKVAKNIDEEEKNQARIKQIKRSFSIGKAGSARKEAGMVQSTKKPFKLNRQNQEIVGRLGSVRKNKQSLMRDRHGNRCNLYEDPESEQTNDNTKFFGNSTGFKTSHKMKLQLPHNYYPGPGTYQMKRFLEERTIKSARTTAVDPKESKISG